MDKNKKRAIRILAVFLAVMALCTVISRAAASVLVAQVKVEKIKKGRLTYTWEGKGQIVPAQETKLFLWPQQQVESAAKEGSTVKAGDWKIPIHMKKISTIWERNSCRRVPTLWLAGILMCFRELNT